MKVIKKLHILIMGYWRYACKNGTNTSVVELMSGIFSVLPVVALVIAALSVF